MFTAQTECNPKRSDWNHPEMDVHVGLFSIQSPPSSSLYSLFKQLVIRVDAQFSVLFKKAPSSFRFVTLVVVRGELSTSQEYRCQFYFLTSASSSSSSSSPCTSSTCIYVYMPSVQ